MIFGVRHGERADFSSALKEEKENIEIPFDPHLTKLGQLQAQQTGKLIQEKINEYNRNLHVNNPEEQEEIEVIIITSPFLRCVMTAFEIAKQMKKVYENSIFFTRSLL